MRARNPLALVAGLAIAVAIAVLVVPRPGRRADVEPIPEDVVAGDPPSAALRATERPAAAPVPYPPPPPTRPGSRRLRVIAVGPADEARPDAVIEAWVFARSGGGSERRMLEAVRTAPDETWFDLPGDSTFVWLRASARGGAWVTPAEVTEDVPRDAPDPHEVRVPLFAPARIEVRVVDEAGRAIANAQVTDHRDAPRGDLTDAAGRTVLRGLMGDVFLKAVSPTHMTPDATGVRAAPGRVVEATLTCRPRRAVVGRAVDAAGRALEGTVFVRSVRAPLADDGSFRVEPLALPDDARERGLHVTVNDEGRRSEADVSLPREAAGPVIDLGTIRLPSAWKVPVRVLSRTGEPLPGLLVRAVRGGQPFSPQAIQPEEAVFYLENGEYRLEATGFTVRMPDVLTVAGRWRGEPARFTIEDAVVVRGRCRFGGRGTPSWKMLHVRCRSEGLDLWSLLDAHGGFEMPIPASRSASPLEISTPYATLWQGVWPSDRDDWIVDLPPDRCLTLVVRALGATGKPVSFRSASFARVPRGTEPAGWFRGASPDGETEFWPVPTGTYAVTVETWDGTSTTTKPFELVGDRQVVTVDTGR